MNDHFQPQKNRVPCGNKQGTPCPRTRYLQVLRSDRVAGAIRVREGVQERVQRALHEVDEGLLDGELAAAAQHRVLQNVRHPRAILGRGAECHPENLIRRTSVRWGFISGGWCVCVFEINIQPVCVLVHFPYEPDQKDVVVNILPAVAIPSLSKWSGDLNVLLPEKRRRFHSLTTIPDNGVPAYYATKTRKLLLGRWLPCVRFLPAGNFLLHSLTARLSDSADVSGE